MSRRKLFVAWNAGGGAAGKSVIETLHTLRREAVLKDVLLEFPDKAATCLASFRVADSNRATELFAEAGLVCASSRREALETRMSAIWQTIQTFVEQMRDVQTVYDLAQCNVEPIRQALTLTDLGETGEALASSAREIERLLEVAASGTIKARDSRIKARLLDANFYARIAIDKLPQSSTTPSWYIALRPLVHQWMAILHKALGMLWEEKDPKRRDKRAQLERTHLTPQKPPTDDKEGDL